MAGNNNANPDWAARPALSASKPPSTEECNPTPAEASSRPIAKANSPSPAEWNRPSQSKPWNKPWSNTTPAERNQPSRNKQWQKRPRPLANNPPSAAANNQSYGKASRSSIDGEVGSLAKSVLGPGQDRIEAYAPVLTTHHAPRPNPKFLGSTPGSLPSLPPFDDEGDLHVGNLDSISNKRSHSADIRNTIGLERNPIRPSQIWEDDPWSEVSRARDQETLRATSFGSKLVQSWADMAPRPPNFRPTLFGSKGHWYCDIDTFNGALLEPVNYPETLPSVIEGKRETNWNQLNWTSSLLMRRYNDLSKKNQNNPRFRVPVYDTSEDHMDEEALKQARADATRQILARAPPYTIESPRTPCYLRPATAEDMVQVSAIYNWEVANGFQALDSKPLSRDDFAEILARVGKLHMPFLVAVHGHAHKLGLKQGNLEYTKCVPHPGATEEPSLYFEGKIMGFAFLSVWEPGLADYGNGSSRATAKVNLFVHHDHRRKHVGFSLLDKLLSIPSSRYDSTMACNFVDASDSPIYKHPVLKLERQGGQRVVEQERKYFRVYLDFHVRHKYYDVGDPKLKEEQKDFDRDLDWARKLLDESFHFAEKVRFDQVFRKNGVWLDKVTFEHTCYLTDDMDGNENY
ncbi:hypothetical protein B0T25DRAFT_566994 [Lasiosphaeria hispida]|uniref:Uncharacterized protein n=1 Tax=Lasiosphaeria hispida TaxID=260671 RepID=A0AAJ0HN14_9PEZI|nr:hypothetical protein B0T25DRAFT_566994 [Lasiosphaeria hispida]